MIHRVKSLKPGDVQSMVFEENDPPPFYNPSLPKQEYVGQPKGIYQVWYERGLYLEGMRGSYSKKEIEKRIAEGLPLLDPSLDAALEIC